MFTYIVRITYTAQAMGSDPKTVSLMPFQASNMLAAIQQVPEEVQRASGVLPFIPDADMFTIDIEEQK